MFGQLQQRYQKVLRAVSLVTLTTTTWLFMPTATFAAAFHAAHPIKPHSRLPEGLTQTPDAELVAKIAQKEKAHIAKKVRQQPDVRELSSTEMVGMLGRGPYRNKAFNGTLPWQRSLRDVNLCNGNLSKSYTDIQVASSRGQGLTLQRTYNSDDDTEGAFGIGWMHTYDIRIEEAGQNATTGDDQVVRTDFWGGKHTYTRDADGIYTPPSYLYDETSSEYDSAMVDGPPASVADTDKGMDGTVKHFVPVATLTDGSVNHGYRMCDYIQDRHSNQTTLTYGLTITNPDGSTRKLLTQVADAVGRGLTIYWQNLGTVSDPHWRITEVDGPGYPSTANSYRVTYEYYVNSGDPASYRNLWKVHLDPDGLNRTTTYTYTSYSSASGIENGLLASVSDPLGHTVSYLYALPDSNPTGTVWVSQVSEPSGEDESGVLRTAPLVWTISPGYWNSVGSGILMVSFSFHDINPYWQYYLEPAMALVDTHLRVIGMGASSNIFPIFSNAYDVNNNVLTQTTMDRNSGMLVPGSPNTLGPYNQIVNSTYGPHGNVLTQQTTGFSDTTTTTYYDASKYFQKASVTDGNGHTVTFDYYMDDDPNPGNRGEIKWVRDAGYAVSTNPSYGKECDYTYNYCGQKESETNLNGVVTQYIYGDSWGNLTQVIQDSTPSPTDGQTHLNRTTSMTHDMFGHIVQSTDPNGKSSTVTYNTLGQSTQTSFPATASMSAENVYYTYGPNGRTDTVTDNRGTTTIAYEQGCDRVKSVTDPMTGTITYHYLPEGMRNQVILPDGKVYTYTYQNNLDENNVALYPLLPKDDPDSLSYRLLSITDDANRKVEMVYYDADGWNTNPPPTDSWLGLISGVRYNETYDASGNLVSYCQQDNLRERVGPSSPALLIMNSKFQLAQRKTTWHQSVSGSWQQSTLSQNDYTYNNIGLRLTNQITDSNANVRTESYGYDPQNRLKTVDYGDGETQGYNFDAMGNRVGKTDNGSYGNESYSFDAANRLTGVASSGPANGSYTNDANGNALTGGGRTNSWDSQNRLVQVAKNSFGSAFIYGYDGLRHRGVVTQSDGTKCQTDYVYDGQTPVEEVIKNFDANNNQVGPTVTSTYLQGPQGPLYKKTSASADPAWYIYDGLGSVISEVNVTGNITGSKLYDVFGATRSLSGTPTSRQGFVGGLGHISDDETGLIYMKARYYDPITGRFASEDPGRDGPNWFTYCDNDPVNRVDTNGKIVSALADSTYAAIEAVLLTVFGQKYVALLMNILRACGSYDDVEEELRFVDREMQEEYAAAKGEFLADKEMAELLKEKGDGAAAAEFVEKSEVSGARAIAILEARIALKEAKWF